MLINPAHAQEALNTAAEAPVDPAIFNLGLIFLLFIIFYFLMIRPQSKRMKEQKAMLDSLEKNDTVLTAGGLVGKITKVISDKEVEVEISKGIKVNALRYTIQEKLDPSALSKPTNDNATASKSAKSATKTTAKTSSTAKKTTAKKSTGSAKKAGTTNTAKKTTTKKS
jgi:preprotein translocase subunit YajC